MKRLFVTMLLTFFASLLVFVFVMSIIFFFGFKKSASGWSTARRKTIEEQIQNELSDILSREDGLDDREIKDLLRARMRALFPNNILIVVYDSDKNVIFTQGGPRSRGRRNAAAMGTLDPDILKLTIKTVKIRAKTAGYYSIGTVGFGADRAGTRFIASMRKTVIFSVGFAFVLSFLFALLFSKKISDSAQKVAEGINQIARGRLSVRIPKTKVKEITLIAESANELGRKLKNEEALRKQWAADIAHDLRTPITALKSQLEGMAEGVLNLTKKRIRNNLTELQRIEVLVNDLGELTRLESPELQLQLASIDVDGFFHELSSRFEQQFKQKQITFTWKKNIDIITADENLLQRAVSNFISNAVRHTPAKGSIQASIKRDGEGCVITVFNTGKGIPEAERDKVFNRLFRGEYARSTPGSGLGLTIAQKIAELHNGKVTIKSNKNRGTTVDMRISARHE